MNIPLHQLRMLAAIGALLIFVGSSAGAGITLITHGYNSDADGWVSSMAEDIPQYYPFPGTNFTAYKMVLTYDSGYYYFNINRTGGVHPTNNQSGEIIVALDWSQMAGGLWAPYNHSTYDVAWVIGQVMMLTNAFSELGGRPVVELPIHLIGHSRGGSLMNELCKQLGTNGVWIDHLTTLDPHPLNNDGNFEFGMPTDATAYSTYQNVLFRDNYWQENFDGFLDPSGEEVAGAYNRQLVGFELAGGYEDVSTFSVRHSNVHLWYHATFNFDLPMTDGAAFVDSYERNNWWTDYENYGVTAGMYYSRLAGGDRIVTDMPAGFGTSAIVDGYNQMWDLGAGTDWNRTQFPAYKGKWPNIVDIRLTGTNSVERGGLIGITFFTHYAGFSNATTVEVYYDRDLNPYTTNNTLIYQTQLASMPEDSVYIFQNLWLTTTNVPPGTYGIYAKITDGVMSRYMYLPQPAQILAPPPPTLDIAKLTNGRFRIGVNGRTNQTVVVELSPDLKAWSPVATNTMKTSRWLYTNTPPVSAAIRYYRATVKQ